MEFLIYEQSEHRQEIKEVTPKQLYHWVNNTSYTYVKKYEINAFGQNAKLGQSIMSDFEYGYLIVTRIR
ncbi:MAG: hypothetical protein KME47_09805 [Nodosilinea sp. WJT8-NPBG4]|jgi:hypothetical protein|nr:hypothetical protein [Nodosilinea sp. WJT8-NPBG4]